MKKVFIPMEKVRNDSFNLVKTVIEQKFYPTILYAVTRGGTYVANPISEYFSLIQKDVKYGVVNARSYKGPYEQEKIKIEGWIPKLEIITKKDKILLVDDIVDKRKTLEALIKDLEMRTPLKRDVNVELDERQIVVVAHDFKIYEGEKDNPKTRPDFYSKKWFVKKGEKLWLFYLSHELVGMNKKERKKYYPKIF